MTPHKKMSLAAALLAGSLIGVAAQAGEITLYQHQNYGGNQITLRRDAPIVSDFGFNDMTSSIVVHSGNWQVCTDGSFTGYCENLQPGDYARLDRRFNDRISSVREIGEFKRGPGSPGPGAYGRGSIQFFDQPGFRGKPFAVDHDTANFVEHGYNDRASSIIVNEGSWELCTDINFGGNCRVFGPGRYADLGPGMNDRLSSARVVRNFNNAPATMRGGWGRVPPNDTGRARVILFEEEGLRGPSIAVGDTMPNLENAAFNDRAASMIVEGGSWLACSDAYFRGNCRVFGPGRYDNLRETGLTRLISSLRPSSPEPVGRRWGGAEGVQLFKDANFAGESRSFTGTVPSLRGTGFNDRAGSMVVNAGEWELCSEAGYSGSCMTVGPGSYASLGGLSKSLSSMRRIR